MLRGNGSVSNFICTDDVWLLVHINLKYGMLQLNFIKFNSHQVWIAGRPRETISIEANLKCNFKCTDHAIFKTRYNDDDDDDDDDRLLLRNGWLMKGVRPVSSRDHC